MKTDKAKLLKDIEAMKEKLASMEEELNKPEVFKHFPSTNDEYYYYTSIGDVWSNTAPDNDLRVNIYKTKEEAKKAYNKAVAIEKIKRRILELQGDLKPDFSDTFSKYTIYYTHTNNRFNYGIYTTLKYPLLIPYMKSEQIAELIIYELEDELKLIFDIS